MSWASVVVVLPPAFDASIAATSSKPPSRLAMSPDGQWLALERGDDADEVDPADVGSDHDDAELVGGEAERLGA